MSSDKKCTYSIVLDADEGEVYHCSRDVWSQGGDEDFCLFHSSYLDQKKVQFDSEILSALTNSPSQLFLSGQREGDGVCDFLGFKFPYDCSAFDYHVNKQIDNHVIFEDCYFEGDFSLSFLEFDEQVEISSSVFDGSFVISYSKLEGNLFIKDIEMDGFLDLSGAKISGHLIIENCKSDCYVTMNGININNTARISGIECAFWFKAEKCKIGKYLRISSCNCNTMSMKESEIDGDLILLRCKVEKEINCSGCYEVNNFQVEDSDATTLNIKGLVYSGLMTVSNLNLNGELDKYSDFSDVVLEKASFIGTDLGTIAFSRSVIREASFDRVTFGLQRRSLDKLWKKAILPAWKPAKYRKDWSLLSYLTGRPREMILEETKARANSDMDERVTQFETAEKVYRSLKHEMEKQHAGNLARRMRAGELECKIHGRHSMADKFFMSLYRSINGYGLRWFRAILVWLIFIVGFACFYNGSLATYEEYSELTKRREIHSIRINALEAFWHSLETTSVIAKPSKSIESQAIKYIEGVEKVVSPLLLLMFIQAFRNKVRD